MRMLVTSEHIRRRPTPENVQRSSPENSTRKHPRERPRRLMTPEKFRRHSPDNQRFSPSDLRRNRLNDIGLEMHRRSSDRGQRNRESIERDYSGDTGRGIKSPLSLTTTSLENRSRLDRSGDITRRSPDDFRTFLDARRSQYTPISPDRFDDSEIMEDTAPLKYDSHDR